MSNNASFLPEDYLAKKAERRTNVVSLVLFALVMMAVFLAFLVTNQKWSKVKDDQAQINLQYQTAAREIRELSELEDQKTQMINKAELAAALVERVPRSILLAELINRMPSRLSLLEFELTSEKIRVSPRSKKDKKETTGRLAPKRGKTKSQAADGSAKIEAPRFRVDIVLTGVAPTDLEVSRYLSELNRFTLINKVMLQYSEERMVDEQVMREFKITMSIQPSADVRSIETLAAERKLTNPMSGDLHLGNASVDATPESE